MLVYAGDPAHPAALNEMRDVDLRQAKLRFVEFRGMALDRVLLPWTTTTISGSSLIVVSFVARSMISCSETASTGGSRRSTPAGPDSFFRRTAGHKTRGRSSGPPAGSSSSRGAPGRTERDRRGAHAEVNVLLGAAGERVLRVLAVVARPIGRLLCIGRAAPRPAAMMCGR